MNFVDLVWMCQVTEESGGKEKLVIREEWGGGEKLMIRELWALRNLSLFLQCSASDNISS